MNARHRQIRQTFAQLRHVFQKDKFHVVIETRDSSYDWLRHIHEAKYGTLLGKKYINAHIYEQTFPPNFLFNWAQLNPVINTEPHFYVVYFSGSHEWRSYRTT